MNNLSELTQICQNKLKELNLFDKLSKRLEDELKEINSQDCVDYFLNFKEKRENENNLLTPYLLGICDTFDMERESVCDYGDFPDLDIDMLPNVRDYIKEEYVRKQFGEDKVCNIVTYQTFGLKSALLDMARIFDLDRNELLAITKKIKPKNEEGKEMTWDDALELYPEFKAYTEKNPEVAEAAKKMLSRVRNVSMHASGVIISSVPIKDHVPLIRVKGSDKPCSAWGEGLSSTNLSAVGLVKFDFLSLNCNMKVAIACEIIERMYGHKVSALPGQSHWTDLSYLNDPKAIEMAAKADLKMIFQFGSEGIRKLAEQCGVSNFNDLVAITSLFRPGSMDLGEVYCNRKNGKEDYEIHPLVQDFMGKTYDILIYQEQVMRMLNVIGKIPLKDCETIRKAISKKKVDKFKKYQDIFIKNGQKYLGWDIGKVENLWRQIEAFAKYSFNQAHGVSYTYSSSRMLYIKSNYPLAFYTSVFACTNGVGDKGYAELKMFQKEAENHGIIVHPVDINKSGTTEPICVVENIVKHKEIYWSLDKIKGISQETARKIIKLQPFKDYRDFLERFGTDLLTNKPLLALKLFGDNSVELYKQYKEFVEKKKYDKKQQERKQRTEEYLERHKGYPEKTLQAITRYEKGTKPFEYEFVLTDKDKEYVKLLNDKEMSEKTFLGFVWKSPLQKYDTKYTIEEYVEQNLASGPIDIEIKSIEEKQGKVKFYKLIGEDILGDVININIWMNEQERFSNYLKEGSCVRINVKSPSNGYPTYNLSYASRNLPKDMDFRITPLHITSENI